MSGIYTYYTSVFSKTLNGNLDLSGFIRVMENLESHGILKNHFPGLESMEFLSGSWKILIWFMEKCIKRSELWMRRIVFL